VTESDFLEKSSAIHIRHVKEIDPAFDGRSDRGQAVRCRWSGTKYRAEADTGNTHTG